MEASCFDFVDIVSPHFGALLYGLCKLFKTGKINAAFTQYVDIVKGLFELYFFSG